MFIFQPGLHTLRNKTGVYTKIRKSVRVRSTGTNLRSWGVGYLVFCILSQVNKFTGGFGYFFFLLKRDIENCASHFQATQKNSQVRGTISLCFQVPNLSYHGPLCHKLEDFPLKDVTVVCIVIFQSHLLLYIDFPELPSCPQKQKLAITALLTWKVLTDPHKLFSSHFQKPHLKIITESNIAL